MDNLAIASNGPAPTKRYGCLVVLGANGRTPHCPSDERQKTCFLLKRRETANGLKKVTKKVNKGVLKEYPADMVRSQQMNSFNSRATIANKHASRMQPENDEFPGLENGDSSVFRTHSITYSLSRTKTVQIHYEVDERYDLFQVGRSLEGVIDMVIVDDELDQRGQIDSFASRKLRAKCSTISRFACRFTVERDSPYNVRIFAGGFDEVHHIALGEIAPKIRRSQGELDALTTNGVLIKKPSGEWHEVSVNGYIYTLRNSRSSAEPGEAVPLETNILEDNTLIDLCGCVLLFRNNEFLKVGPKWQQIEMLAENLNITKPQCPVRLQTLKLSPKGYNIQKSSVRRTSWPFVFVKCGHVNSDHSWDDGEQLPDDDHKIGEPRTCPLCRQRSKFIQLSLGLEPAFLQDFKALVNEVSLAPDPDRDPLLTHCFVPCGHVTTAETANYWSQKVRIPKGTMTFEHVCPFCLIKLDNEFSICKLLFA